MIAPINGHYASGEKEPHTIEWTILYYANGMNNGLGDRLNYIAINLGIKSQDIPDLKQSLYISLRRLAENSPHKQIDNPDAYITRSFRTECWLLRRREAPRKDKTSYGIDPYELNVAIPNNTNSPILNSSDKERLTAILEAMGQLVPKAADAVRLHYSRGFTYQEAGEILGVPMGTVQSRVHRGVRAIREYLGIGLDESVSK